jgi:hypothetical protein
MRKLFLHEDAEADLDELWNSEPRVAAKIEVFLEELRGSQDLLDRITQHDFGTSPRHHPFHVSMWQQQQRLGRNLWRLKLWELEANGKKYRLIYAFIPLKQHHYILGIMPRKNGDFDYDERDPRTQRIVEAYLGL